MKQLSLLFILLLLFSSFAIGQEKAFIKGKVSNAKNNPLEKINVSVQNTKWGTSTNSQGNFEFLLPEGTYTLLFSGVGVSEKKLTINAKAGENNFLKITLLEQSVDLSEVTIISKKVPINHSLTEAKISHSYIPGGTNVVSLEKLRTQRSLTLKDALSSESGVIIQEFFGSNDQARISIRGSGIQGNPQYRGLTLLQDGVPLNFSDGSFLMSLLEPQASNYIEIFRGSNSLKYGGSTLGGAINLSSKTGYTASPLEIKMEGGSFDYKSINLSSGFISGKTDGFVSISYNDSKGYRKHNDSNRLNATFNIGHKFNDKIENRVYVTYTNLEFDVSGPLNWAQIQENPKQNSKGMVPKVSLGPNVVFDKPRRQTQTVRTANKTSYKINEANKLSATFYYQYSDDTFYFPVSTGVRATIHNDVGIHINYLNHTDKNQLTIGLDGSLGKEKAKYFINLNGNKDKNLINNKNTAKNITAYAENIIKLTNNLNAIASLQFSHNIRDIEDCFETPDKRPSYNLKKKVYDNFSATDITANKSYTGVNPKLGLIYKVNNTQFFGNISRSYEPPTFLDLFTVSGGSIFSSPSNAKMQNIEEQTATTFEIGSRGTKNKIHWDLSIYRSWIKDEILTTSDAFGLSGITRNSPYKTIHQGIELGFGVTVFENIFTVKGDTFSLNGVYNYSDFFFDEGVYKGNQIAGVPKHYIIGEIKYNHPIGVFLSLNNEWMPKDTATDHQNTLFQPSFQLFGFRLGYSKNKWSFFLEGKNITDEKYASSYLVRDLVSVPKIFTPQQFTSFVPGTGRNFIIGISYKL